MKINKNNSIKSIRSVATFNHSPKFREVTMSELVNLSDAAMRVLSAICRLVDRKGISPWTPESAVGAFSKSSKALTLRQLRNARDELLDEGHIERIDSRTPLSAGVRVIHTLSDDNIKEVYKNVRSLKAKATKIARSLEGSDLSEAEVAKLAEDIAKPKAGEDNLIGHSVTSSETDLYLNPKAFSPSEELVSVVAELPWCTTGTTEVVSSNLPICSKSSEIFTDLSNPSEKIISELVLRKLKKRRVPRSKLTPSQLKYAQITSLVNYFNDSVSARYLKVFPRTPVNKNDGALRKHFRQLLDAEVTEAEVKAMIDLFVAGFNSSDPIDYPWRKFLAKKPALLQEARDRARLKSSQPKTGKRHDWKNRLL